MNIEIAKLREKHKEFLEVINAELIKENDYSGNYHRLDDYLNDFKGKKVKNKKEKELLLKKMRDDNFAEDSYRGYLHQLDRPRWELETTYPTFYIHFKERFEIFINEWKTAAKLNDLTKDSTDEMFVTYCRYVNAEINYENNYKEALEYVEKNGFMTKTTGNNNLFDSAFIEVLNTLFELPEFIIYTLKNDQEKINKKINELRNRYGKYDKRIFKLAFELQEAAIKNRRSLTDENAIIEANNKLLIIKSDELINEYEQPLPLLMKIAKTYSNYWKPQLRNGLDL